MPWEVEGVTETDVQSICRVVRVVRPALLLKLHLKETPLHTCVDDEPISTIDNRTKLRAFRIPLRKISKLRMSAKNSDVGW